MTNEIIVDREIEVHGKSCSGCVIHQKDIMISFEDENTNGYYNVFMTQQQAIAFLIKLQSRIQENNNQE